MNLAGSDLRLLACVLALLAAVGCSDKDKPPGAATPYTAGDIDPADDIGADAGDGQGRPTNFDPDQLTEDCTEELQLIYLIDNDRNLVRFDPRDNRLERIGTINCPGASDPFSMAVDRNGTAWVLFEDDHRIYQVSIYDATCEASDFAPDQHGFELFGMGFVSDEQGGTTETLYVAGGAEQSLIDMAGIRLATIEPSSRMLSPIGAVGGWPELTGTGAGELFGYFPGEPMPRVEQLDKLDAGTMQSFPLGDIVAGAQAWAFAAWGGVFYVFVAPPMPDVPTNSEIWKLDPSTGDAERITGDSGYQFVGAGVSTCAPFQLI